jgi:hypothetical protein
VLVFLPSSSFYSSVRPLRWAGIVQSV